MKGVTHLDSTSVLYNTLVNYSLTTSYYWLWFTRQNLCTLAETNMTDSTFRT